MKDTRKIAVIGAGRVGAATAYTLSLSALAGEIVLLDVDERRATSRTVCRSMPRWRSKAAAMTTSRTRIS